MKLAEALFERKEKAKKIERLKEEVSSYIITPESETVEEKWVENKLLEIKEASNDFQKINIAIDKANATHQSENLNRLRQLDTLISFYSDLRKKLLGQEHNSRSIWSGEVNSEKKVKNYSYEKLSKKLEDLERERKDLDKTIMKINWNIEI